MVNIINQSELNRNKNANNKEIIVASNVRAEIFDIQLSPREEGVLIFKLKIIEGEHANKVVTDKAAYHPNMSTTWKYFQIREAACVPYADDEDDFVDINALLLNKIVCVDLDKFDGLSKSGKKFNGQRITYLKKSVEELYRNIDIPIVEDDSDEMF